MATKWLSISDRTTLGEFDDKLSEQGNKTRQRFGRRLARRPEGVRIGLSRFAPRPVQPADITEPRSGDGNQSCLRYRENWPLPLVVP